MSHLDALVGDTARALTLFKAAGRLGHAEALCNAGALYYAQGAYEHAFYAYQNAAVCGSDAAHRNLAHMYAHGIGVAQSAKAAAYHTQRAEQRGDAHHALLDTLQEAHEEHVALAPNTS